MLFCAVIVPRDRLEAGQNAVQNAIKALERVGRFVFRDFNRELRAISARGISVQSSSPSGLGVLLGAEGSLQAAFRPDSFS
jgi:hypothetical protein